MEHPERNVPARQTDSPYQPAPARSRRLSDKIMAAIEHAIELGLKDIAERLALVHQTTVDSERKPNMMRRDTDRRFFKARS